MSLDSEMDKSAHNDHGQPPDPHAGQKIPDMPGSHDRHAGHSVAVFRDKFWLSCALTIPVVLCLFIAAAEFYNVRELFAALAIFAVLFGTLGTALLILFLIQKAVLPGVASVEMGMVRVRVRHTAASSPPHSDSGLKSPRWN